VLENDTIYFWRVDAVAADGNTVYTGDIWRFKTMPDIQISDPSLVGWWKLDEGQGTVALDWSGHGNHGTFVGDPQWTGGPDSGALDFDGFGDYVDCGNADSLVIQDSITMAVWFKIDAFIKDWEAIITKGDGAYRISRASAGGALHMGINGTATEWFDGSREVVGGEWHHAACTYDGQLATIYVDGTIDATAQSSGSINATGDSFYIGENSGVGGRFFGGTIDDVRLYNRALSRDEVRQLMEGDSSIATEPGPTNGLITDIKHSEPLSWSSGDGAVEHDVYFGTDLFDVDIADTSTPEIYRGRQGAAGYNPPEGFEWGQDYYWRIDEVKVDGSVTKGNIWSFTITDYIIVDDFEDYNDYPPNEVWMTWLDGYEDPLHNGSSAGYPDPDFVLGEHYLETTVVHGGTQSLPLFYNNSVGLSEITRTFAPSADWTEYGVSTLTLWYSGLESNEYEPMYIALNNEVIYNDDANAGLIPEWTQWDIPLQDFADLGVNLGGVGSITIGFGNRDNPTAGGEGHVFFDDIRLYRP
jgi:hypothetical protein